MRVLVPFCGPGGSSKGIHDALPDAELVGIDKDPDACATHRAAGFETLQADVSTLSPRMYGPADGLWLSPPCQAFSLAGKRNGIDYLPQILDYVATWQLTDGVAWRGDPQVWLVTEPLRWAYTLYPEWVCCEQVPAVLPVWLAIAERLRQAGYWAWCGVLNSADYGVPQTRERAFLLASRLHPVQPPEATHAEHPHPRLDGTDEQPWVSMAEAVGWGMTMRPSFTIVSREKHGAPQVADGGSGARRSLERERERERLAAS